MRARAMATIPTTIGLETATNPFFRPNSVDIRRALQLEGEVGDVDVVAALRRNKDAAAGVIGWIAMSLYRVADYFGFA